MEETVFRKNFRRLRRLFQPGRLVRIRRYMRYRNATRQLQIALSEMRAGKTVVRARPVYMNLDTGPICNLRCPFCWTGSGIGALKRTLLKPETFAQIARHLPLESLYEVGLFNWGEPLLNPHLFDYIRFFARKGIRVVIHTNFSVASHDENFMEALVQTGISEVVASVDGASPETYVAYRVGGDFHRVVGNLELLARTCKRLGRDDLTVVYKMLLNRFNQHEVDQARELAASLGVTFLLQEHMGMPQADRETWLASSVLEKYGEHPVSGVDADSDAPIQTECRQMWETLVVNADGAVFPCCIVADPDSAVGNLAEQPFEAVWNGEKMQQLRRFVLDTQAPHPPYGSYCAGCSFRNCIYGRRRHHADIGPQPLP